MPMLYHRVDAPGINILKTVTDQVVYGLLKELDLTDTFKDSTYIMSSFMASSDYSDRRGRTTLTVDRCDVDVSYVMDKSQVPWPVDSPATTTATGSSRLNSGRFTPILADPEVGVLVEHRTIACALEMNFSLTFVSFDSACAAFDTIQSLYKGSLTPSPFDLGFSYPVSMSLFSYLISVWKARDIYKAHPFLDYVQAMKKTEISFDVRKSQLANTDADTELMIRCLQKNCPGLLTMDQKEPEVVRENGLPDYYTVQFSFTVQFGRPTIVQVTTPICINNTLLPDVFFTNTDPDHSSPTTGAVTQDLLCTDYLKRSYGNYPQTTQIIRIPVYDDWVVTDSLYHSYAYRPFLIAHFTWDGLQSTLNLSALGDIRLHPDIATMFKQMGSDLLRYGNIFNVSIFAGDTRVDPSLVHIDANLNLTLTSNRSDVLYHLVLSESTDLFKTSVDYDQQLIKYRYLFPVTIERHLDMLIEKGFFKIDYDNSLLRLISALAATNRLRSVIQQMVTLGEDTPLLGSHTQNPSQLADYLALHRSLRVDYRLPTGTDSVSQVVRQFYTDYTSVDGRSLLVAFLEQCLILGYITLDRLPEQYLIPNPIKYPYYPGTGGYYGFNTPLRVLTTNILTERRGQ